MSEISHSSDRMNSQGGHSENRSRQNSDRFHRRLAGLDGAESMLTGRMDPGASTSGSKNDVGRSWDELEGVRRKSDEEKELDRKFNNYIQEKAKNNIIAIISERNKYYKFKEDLFNDQKRSDEEYLDVIEQYVKEKFEQYVKEKFEQPIEEPKQKSSMQQLLKRLVKHTRNCLSDQERPTHKLDFNDNKEQKELDACLNGLLENNKDIRLEILKLLKNKIRKISDSDKRMSVFNNWTTEIGAYLASRTTVSICQDVMNDIRYCYAGSKAPESHIISLLRQE